MAGLTLKEAAALVGVSVPTVRGWVSIGLLPLAQSGPPMRVRAAAVYDAQRSAHLGTVVPRWRADPVRAGQRLRSLREVARLNQQDLAARCGIAHETISRLEHGNDAPTSPTIIALCRALGCAPERFVSDEAIGLQTLSTAEAAARLGVPASRVMTWVKQGVLSGTKFAGRWRVPAIAVAELERSGRLRGASRRLDG